MTTSRTQRVGSVAALALAASSGVALVSAAGPAAADTPAPVASSGYALSIAVAVASIHPGTTDTVSGVLTHAGSAAAGDTVYLRAQAAGKHHAHRAATGMTAADGSVSFAVTPAKSTHYRLVFRVPSATTPAPVPVGTAPATKVAAHSKVATVHVLRDSTLSIRDRTLKNGHVRVMGQLRGGGHALAGRKIELQVRAPGETTWKTIKTRRSNKHGAVNYGVGGAVPAQSYQLVFTGGPNFDSATSGVVAVG